VAELQPLDALGEMQLPGAGDELGKIGRIAGAERWAGVEQRNAGEQTRPAP